jgi:hypothetical protein
MRGSYKGVRIKLNGIAIKERTTLLISSLLTNLRLLVNLIDHLEEQ